MHHPLRMGRGQGPRGLSANAEDLLHFQRARGVEPLLKRTAGHVLHDKVGQSAKLIHRVDRHDVLVPDGRGGPRLASEPAAAGGRRAPVRASEP